MRFDSDFFCDFRVDGKLEPLYASNRNSPTPIPPFNFCFALVPGYNNQVNLVEVWIEFRVL